VAAQLQVGAEHLVVLAVQGRRLESLLESAVRRSDGLFCHRDLQVFLHWQYLKKLCLSSRVLLLKEDLLHLSFIIV